MPKGTSKVLDIIEERLAFFENSYRIIVSGEIIAVVYPYESLINRIPLFLSFCRSLYISAHCVSHFKLGLSKPEV